MTSPTADRLTLLYRVSQVFNSTLDLGEVLARVVDEVIAATRAERGFLMLREADGQLAFRAARGIDRQTIDRPEFQISRSVVDRVAREGRPLLTSNAQDDVRLKIRTSVVKLGLRSILCVPLQVKGDAIGVVYVDNRLQSGIFTPDDLELLNAIAASAAVAIDNARLYQVAVEKGRLERELQVARDVQISLLPRDTPRVEGWEFAARWKPARQVAGDFYDFIALDAMPHSAGGGPAPNLGIVVADVSDKGMPAALFMSLARSIVRASVVGARSPAAAIAQANRLICADAANGMFVTIFYGQIAAASGELVYVNGGHNPPLVYHAETRECVWLTNTGMALGFFDSAAYEQRSAHLDAGDFILFYTDGVTEAMDAHRREFGPDRLQRILLDNSKAAAEDLAAALELALIRHTGAAAPHDDITFVIARRV